MISRKGVPQVDAADPFWWGLAAVLGLLSLLLPQLLRLEADRTTEVLVVESALFFSGGLLGCLCPRRVWRWALAAFLAFAFYSAAYALGDPRYNGAPVQLALLNQFLDNAPLYLVQSLPVLAGSYIGYFASSAGLR